MTLVAKSFLAALLAILIAAPFALAQAQRTYSQAELDRMLAPIALYPDPLLSQILMASAYPLEIVEAARWSRANPGLQGDDAVRAVQNEDWDPSVKSLVAFPQVLQRMDENREWARSLGDAFLAQQPHVMETVQQLRRRAQAAGNLQSSEQIQVQQQGQAILVQPVHPRYIYVPYYDPMVVYGPWWWPAYPPVVWAPWPGYVRYHRPGVSVGFWWGAPVGLSVNFFFGNVDWHRRHVRVVHVNNYYYRPLLVVNRAVLVTPQRWQHDPSRRRGIAFGAPDGQRTFAATARPAPAAPAAAPVAPQPVVAQPAAASVAAQPVVARPAAAPVVAQPAAAPVASKPVVPATRENRIESRNRVDRPRNEVRADPRVAPRIERRAEPRIEPRVERRAESRALEVRPQAQQAPRPQVRMPAASAPQQPRVERQEARRELRQEPRNEHGRKGRDRS